MVLPLPRVLGPREDAREGACACPSAVGAEGGMSALRITGLPNRRRVYLFGRRTHHGAVGSMLVFLGAVLCWHDRRDLPWIFDR